MGALREQVHAIASERRARVAQAQAKREAERLQRYEAELRDMMKTPDVHWQLANAQVSRGIASSYEEATRTLKMLADGYALVSRAEAFGDTLQRFLVPHAKRSAFLRRLDAAGLRST